MSMLLLVHIEGGRLSGNIYSTNLSIIKSMDRECMPLFPIDNNKLLHRCRLSRRSNRMHSIDWTILSSSHNDPMASDVIAPSAWTIFGCTNGLRLFTEAKDGGSRGKYWDDHPAIMAVGVVDANSEDIFQTLMSLGQSRSEGMRKRDLLLRRYWRREDDGTYGGGYVISPVSQGRQSVVKHMLAIDWKFWKSYLLTSSAKYITIRMLGRVAALRELFRAKNGNCACMEFSSGELMRDMGLPQGGNERTKIEMQSANECERLEGPVEGPQGGSNRHLSSTGSLVQLNDATDEFFDVPDESEYDQREAMWSSDESTHAADQRHAKLSSAAVFVRKLHDLAVQKRGYVDLQGAADADNGPCYYGHTLPKDSSCTMPSSWSMTDPTTFLIRGESYLLDRQKIKAENTLMQMVGADWIKSDKREDDLAGRPGGLVQKYAAQGGSKFFFIVNIQVPGSTTYSLALYYMMDTPLEKVPLLERFVNGDDTFRNSRFKLIPYISKGSWIVKQSVGKKACLVGQALEINYFRGSNYLELGVDIGSSTVARGVVSLVLGYLNNLVIEMAFLVQGNTQEELPEFLLGTCRLNYLDASKAVSLDEC
uniref:Protein ENHANCED DISEASE RESISTANCE 2 C-terminal domain-containing protein n=1 Tax=Aegilops tauschii subsp. strangulata TaxID=200361 RepID=A0A452YGB1_AEGTS